MLYIILIILEQMVKSQMTVNSNEQVGQQNRQRQTRHDDPSSNHKRKEDVKKSEVCLQSKDDIISFQVAASVTGTSCDVTITAFLRRVQTAPSAMLCSKILTSKLCYM